MTVLLTQSSRSLRIRRRKIESREGSIVHAGTELKDLPAKKVRVVFEDAGLTVLYRGEIRKYRIEEGKILPGRRVP